MIQCEICKKKFNSITNTHLKKHNLTLKEYIKIYKYIRPNDVAEKQRKTWKEKWQKFKSNKVLYKQYCNNKKKIRQKWIDENFEKYKELNKKASIRMIKNNPMKNKKIVEKTIETNRKKGNYLKASERLSNMWKNEKFREKGKKRMRENNPSFNKEIHLRSTLNHNRKKSGIEEYFEKLISDNKLLTNSIEYVGNNKFDATLKAVIDYIDSNVL